MIGLNAVSLSIFLTLFVKTYFGSKLQFLLNFSAVFSFGRALTIVVAVLDNWVVYGVQQKNITEKQRSNIGKASSVSEATYLFTSYWCYWYFTWRYWKTAELLHSLKVLLLSDGPNDVLVEECVFF